MSPAKKGSEKIRSNGNVFDISSIFHQLMDCKEGWKKILYFAIFLMFSILLVPMGFVFGYIYYFIKNVLNGKREILPKWDFKDGKYMSDMFINGWKLFLVWLPFLVLNILFGLLMRTFLFFIPVIIQIATAFVLPYFMILFVEKGNFKDLFEFSGLEIYIKKEWINIILALIISIGISVFASFGAIGLIFVFYTWSWAIFILSYMWANIYIDYKNKEGK
ncbi:DUF4013 domain-containing protein [bacterium]|nr:DUF4013 domain-containing protein [bacterium]